jgi:hypothetical protein
MVHLAESYPTKEYSYGTNLDVGTNQPDFGGNK